MKLILRILFALVLLLTIFSLVSFAEVNFDNGSITGLKSSASYEYTYVTLENYNSSLDSIDVTNSAFESVKSNSNGVITGINDAGIIFLRNKNDYEEIHYVFIEGDPLERSVISEKIMNSSGSYNIPVHSYESAKEVFVQGKWTGPKIYVNDSFITTHNGHVSSINAQKIYNELQQNGVISESLKKTIKGNIENAHFGYSYLPHEIIPVDELYTVTYESGYHQSCVNIISPTSSAVKTKFVLYTISKNGKVTKQSQTVITEHKNTQSSSNLGTYSSRHTISISSHFPEATGYVLGFEIYPYGELPNDATFTVTPSYNGTFITTMYSVNFIHDGYTTKWKNDRVIAPIQYNGANTAYINGYGDGRFLPNETITRAEISSIITKLISDTFPIGNVSRFKDVLPGEWYYENIAYLESIGIFDYIEGESFNPNEKITRGELAKILSKFVKVPKKESGLPFNDTSGHKFEVSIKALYEIGAINGYGDNTFRPDNNITRAETVTIINRLINLTVNDETVIKDLLPIKFSDVSGHWAENDVLMASNDNVKTKYHIEAKNVLSEDDDFIYFETKLTRVKIAKKMARVEEFVYKKNGEDVLATSFSPFFATITYNSGLTISPAYAEISDKRLHVVFSDGTEAYFIIEIYDNFFTVSLDSEIPEGIATIAFAIFGTRKSFSMEDEDSFRLSNVSMDTRLILSYAPGGASRATKGYTSSKIGDVIGVKIAIAFSEYGGQKDGLHRKILKEITDEIDPSKGLKSTKGGAYAIDAPEVFYDYTIVNGFNGSNAENHAKLAHDFDVEILDLHFGSSTFTTGDFNFVGAKTGSEEFTDGKVFKERVLDPISEYDRKISIHSYCQGVDATAKSIVSNPNWQKDLYYTSVYTLKDALTSTETTVNTYEDASNYKVDTLPMPYTSTYGTSQYLLIDEEIIRVSQNKGTASGFVQVARGQLGTKAEPHKDGAEIRHLACWFGVFHAIPGSDLFWYVADQHAKAYNDTGAIMIYLDCQDIMTKLCSGAELYYYQAEFVRRIIEGCNTDPLIESANNGNWMWGAAGKQGAIDVKDRAIKRQKKEHYRILGIDATKKFLLCNLGWFSFDTSSNTQYRNVYSKLLFRDDMDYMGSVAIASDFAMTPRSLNDNPEQRNGDNYRYYSVYSTLRKAGYFAEEVKKEIRNGVYEYRVFKKDDGAFAFREMQYVEKKVDHVTTDTERTGSATNPFDAHTPFIRIEQKFSTLKSEGTVLLALDENAEISTVSGTYSMSDTDITAKRCLAVRVYGNGQDGAILISLKSSSSSGRYDYFIPTSHVGYKEFYLLEVDNAEYSSKYSFSQANTEWNQNATYSSSVSLDKITSVIIGTSGNVQGVRIDDIVAYKHSDAPAKNPSVTIGSKTITFNTEIHSGDFIEYYPDTNKAYLNYFENIYNASTGKWEKNIAHVKEITHSGSISVPSGIFTYEYNAEALSDAPLRARVKIGLQGKIIENPDTWIAPEVDMGNATLDIITK